MKRVYLACAMLALLTCSTTQSIAQTQSVDRAMSPVEEMRRASDETLRILLQIQKLPPDRVDESRKLCTQLKEAEDREDAIDLRISTQAEAAAQQGNSAEANRLYKLSRDVRSDRSDRRRKEAGRSKYVPPDVVISEVCYLPKQGECEWVELANVTDNPVNIDGWVLRDGQTLKFVLPAKLAPLPPKGFVLVLFDGTDAPPSDFDKNGKAVVHTPARLKGDVLGDEGGHLALYGPNEGLYGVTAYRTVVRGYVAWGKSPGAIAQDAVEAKRWGAIDNVPRGTTDEVYLGELNKVMPRGGSLRVLLDQVATESAPIWSVVGSEAVSPGAAGEKLVPRLLFQRERPVVFEDGSFSCWCTEVDVPDVRYHYQIFQDKECNKVLLDTTIGFNRLDVKKPGLHSKEMYVRVRAIYPDGTAGKWSAIEVVGRNDQIQEK